MPPSPCPRFGLAGIRAEGMLVARRAPPDGNLSAFLNQPPFFGGLRHCVIMLHIFSTSMRRGWLSRLCARPSPRPPFFHPP